MERIKSQVISNNIPSYFNFWKVLYWIYNNTSQEITPDLKEQAIIKKFESKNFQWSKYMIDEDEITIDWQNEYLQAAADIYYLGNQALFQYYNNMVLSINPNNYIAISNEKFYCN